MEFRILGPLEIRQDGRPLPCKGAKQRLVLAVLLLQVNEVVSSDRLIDALWGDDPPPTAQKALQVHVSQLRRLLEPGVLITQPPGYVLQIAGHELDVHAFERRTAEAREATAAGRPERASALFSEALGFWRGSPLADLAFEDCLQPEIARLEELRLTAVEDRLDADLALGRHATVIAELEHLAALHPLRERIRGQLMLALYRSGRQADALDVYADTRGRLVEELGLEPSRELQRLQQQALGHDPVLDLPQAIAEAPAADGLLGREQEFAQLCRAVDGATEGRTAVVLVGGEPGIGKSRLADALARHAHASGARVAVGRCWEAGGAPAFWPWVQALRTILGDSDIDALTDLTGAAGGGRDVQGARFQMFESVGGLLRSATDEGPIAIFLDDLHAADAGTLLLLRFIAADLAQTPIVIVGCYRDTEVGPELAEAIAELSREPVTTRLSLKGLDADATSNLLALAMGAAPPAELVERVQAETRGNPLFASELGRLFAVEGISAVAGQRLPIPDGVREAIHLRLERHSKHCRDLLGIASVAGREFDATLLASVSGLPPEELAHALAEAVATGIIGELPGTPGRSRFSHILVRDALYDELPPARRVELHRAVGDALAALHAAHPGTHLAEIAYHYSEAGPAAEAAAVDYALRAAVHAESQYGYEDAARHYASALRLLGAADPATTCDVLLAQGSALSRAGKSTEAKELLREAAALAEARGWPERLARAALTYGGRFAWARGSTDPLLVPLLETALAGVGDGDRPTRARLLARLAAALRDEPDRVHRVALAQEAVDIARTTDDLVTRAYAVEGYWIAAESAETLHEGIVIGDELIALGRQIGDREHEFTGRDFRLNAYWKLADRAGVDVELEVLTLLAEELRQPAWRWWVRTTRTMVTLMEGRLEEAEQLIRATRTFGEQAERWNAHVSERLQLFVLRRQQGELSELADVVARSVHEYPTLLRFGAAHAHLQAELGREHAARAAFDAVMARDLARDHVDAEWLFTVAMLPDPARFLGDQEAAALLYSLLLPHVSAYAQAPVEASFGSMSRALGVLATMLDRFDDAAAHFETALEVERQMRAWPWLAHAQHDFAAMLVTRAGRGDRERARLLLDDAVRTYGELGMRSWAERALQVL